jgi:RHS repeat-associated protein
MTWAGVVQGSVQVGYNGDFRVTSQTVDGTNSLSFSYDRDGLLTAAGALGLKRHAQHGMVDRDSLDTVKSAWGYTSRAALASYAVTSGATTLYQAAYTRDSLDRITSLTEAISDTTTTSAFTYDSAGRLFEVRRDGVLTATYEYDVNGNRTRLTTPSGVMTGTYDDQDRLTSYGTTSYSYGSNGELKTKTEPGVGTTSYTYDALGNLVAAALPDGTALAYVTDGQNRRVGKRVNGVLVQGFLYQGQLAPVAELDGGNQVVSRFVYASRLNVPTYMIKGGLTYRLITDHLGTVRLVVNTTDGTVAQRIDYDEFGRITRNTAPDFQPFGYAGGLLDSRTGLTRFGARDYDPAIGRWTAKDPLSFAGGDGNLYSYVANNPISQSDPYGLWTAGIGIGGSAAGWLRIAGSMQFTFSANGFNPVDWRFGLTSSVEPFSSASSAVGAANLGPTFSLSPNAQKPEEFNGWSATMGGSAGLGAVLGFDVSNLGGGPLNYTLSPGDGYVFGPYVAPAEVHFGASFSCGISISPRELLSAMLRLGRMLRGLE